MSFEFECTNSENPSTVGPVAPASHRSTSPIHSCLAAMDLPLCGSNMVWNWLAQPEVTAEPAKARAVASEIRGACSSKTLVCMRRTTFRTPTESKTKDERRKSAQIRRSDITVIKERICCAIGRVSQSGSAAARYVIHMRMPHSSCASWDRLAFPTTVNFVRCSVMADDASQSTISQQWRLTHDSFF